VNRKDKLAYFLSQILNEFNYATNVYLKVFLNLKTAYAKVPPYPPIISTLFIGSEPV
jgi:hypothetical protein